jgi:hypothetical protein
MRNYLKLIFDGIIPVARRFPFGWENRVRQVPVFYRRQRPDRCVTVFPIKTIPGEAELWLLHLVWRRPDIHWTIHGTAANGRA